ncbi:MAG TPA: hypothetical protein VFQ35_14070 [Polyangiaceae bacterium]|nr:hypothetical protein [Polyangiaceae bacterium]
MANGNNGSDLSLERPPKSRRPKQNGSAPSKGGPASSRKGAAPSGKVQAAPSSTGATHDAEGVMKLGKGTPVADARVNGNGHAVDGLRKPRERGLNGFG